MSGVNICWVVREGVGSGVGGYQPGVYVPLKALFLVLNIFVKIFLINGTLRKNAHSIYRDVLGRQN